MKWTLLVVLCVRSYKPKTCLVALAAVFLSVGRFSHLVNLSAMLENHLLETGNFVDLLLWKAFVTSHGKKRWQFVTSDLDFRDYFPPDPPVTLFPRCWYRAI